MVKTRELSTCDKRHFIRWQCKIGPWLYHDLACLLLALLVSELKDTLARTHTLYLSHKKVNVYENSADFAFFIVPHSRLLSHVVVCNQMCLCWQCHTGLRFGPQVSDIMCIFFEFSLLIYIAYSESLFKRRLSDSSVDPINQHISFNQNAES